MEQIAIIWDDFSTDNDRYGCQNILIIPLAILKFTTLYSHSALVNYSNTHERYSSYLRMLFFGNTIANGVDI